MVAVLVGKAGGWAEVLNKLPQAYATHIPAFTTDMVIMLVALVFMTSFGTWGLPQMVQKFYAIKNESMILKAAIVTTLFSIIIVFAAYFNGALSHLFFNAPPLLAGKPDFDRLIPDLLHKFLPDTLMAVILLLVLSASMSTLSSLVLVSSSAVAIDLYQGRLHPEVKKERLLFLMRALSGVFVLLSFFIAKYEFAIIITLMSLSWGAVAGSFMAPFLYGLFWKKTTRAGAIAGVLSGLTLAVSLFFILGPAKSPISASIAMIVPFAVVPFVSFFTKQPDSELIAQAFSSEKV